MKALFLRQSGAGYLLVALLVTSLSLMYIELSRPWLKGLRASLATVLSPVYFLADLPTESSEWVGSTLSTRSALQEQVGVLERRVLELSQASQQYLAVREENGRLRALLGSRERLGRDVLVAEIVGVLPGADRHQVMIDKGTADGIREGLAVIDEYGMVGQVVEIARSSARVLLVSDVSHALPVQVVRNNLRGIVVGSGQLDELQLDYVPDSADIREGDVLVSSGLAGRFPSGYPVATVSAVTRGTGEAFAQVQAQPSAQLDRSRHVLVLFAPEAAAPTDAFATPPTDEAGGRESAPTSVTTPRAGGDQ